LWTQEELARRVRVSKSFLSEVENDHAIPGGDVLLRLAETLGTTTDYLLRGEPTTTLSNPQPISIPPELDAFAKETGLSYPATIALLDARRHVLAARGEQTAWTREDWKQLYDRIRRHLASS
jgi:transcriptional regulator with XRE-family HTH domain